VQKATALLVYMAQFILSHTKAAERRWGYEVQLLTKIKTILEII
jgi:hypothetical protein